MSTLVSSIERAADLLSPVDGLHWRTNAVEPTLLPSEPLTAGIRYYENQRNALLRLIDHANIPIDNWPTEREFQNVAKPRLNMLFAGSTEGAHRACGLLGTAATCRAVGMPTQADLAWAFERLGTHRHVFGLELADLTPAAFKLTRAARLAPRAQAPRGERRTRPVRLPPGVADRSRRSSVTQGPRSSVCMSSGPGSARPLVGAQGGPYSLARSVSPSASTVLPIPLSACRRSRCPRGREIRRRAVVRWESRGPGGGVAGPRRRPSAKPAWRSDFHAQPDSGR